MSVEVIRIVRCDAGCGARFTCTEQLTAVQIRRRAIRFGWHSRMRTRDICPECWEKGKR